MTANRPLALVTDEDLLDDLLKLAAAAGCDLDLVPDATAARQRWIDAPMVVLDTGGAEQCVAAELSRRPGIVLVGADPLPHALWRHGVDLGVAKVIALPGAEPWLVSALADAVEAPATTSGKVVAVLGGRGGAGASVFTAAVGLAALAAGRNALVVDCDPKGGGLDLVLGAESDNGLRWSDMKLKAGRVPGSALHNSLPRRIRGKTQLSLLSGSRKNTGPPPDAVAAVIEGGRRAGDIVVCDLPRELGLSAYAALDRADLTVIVVPSELRACFAAKLLAERLADRAITAQLIVRGPSPGGLTVEEITTTVGLPLLAKMRPEPGLARSLEHGDFQLRPRHPLAIAADATLAVLTAQPAHQPVRELKAA